MDRGMLGNNVATQIGIIVRDIEKTSEAYAKVFGIHKPSWSWTDTEESAHTKYRGASTPARAKLAFMRFGSLDIELIEPDEHPSTWREFLDEHGEGVHHIAFQVERGDERVEALANSGMPAVQTGDYTGGRYMYMDTTSDLKVILELLENR